MDHRRSNQRAWSMVRVACLMVLAGCGQGSRRQSLEGTVTLDGQPLSEGSITFRPQQGTSGPTAGGKISEGCFSISPDAGTFAGTFRVEITASGKTGRKLKDHRTGELYDEIAQFLPARYNRQSELTADVQAAGPNRFEFTLSSQPKP